jgi:cytoskeletal protein RodZ
MADDLYDVFEDSDDLTWEDEEEEEGAAEEAQAEGSNRTFILIASILGGALVCAIGLFAVWWFVLYPRSLATQQQAAGIVDGTPTEEVMVEETAVPETEEPTEQPTETEPTAAPTNTPKPTNTPTPTPVLGNTATPTPDAEQGSSEGSSEGAGAEAGDGTPTATTRPPRRTATPTRETDNPTPTPRSTRTITSSADKTPDTGLGEVLLVVGAILLLGILFAARKLRSA